ncbi:ATP-binding protein [Actinosynnema sp. NPDC059335]|uniref:ATP-binding protein n=1 Tax=Actinosynnema sp. NPDC059335 TaxID=3346804 RepID=UPI00366A65F8
MTTGDADAPLFYLAGATEGTTQWKVETLQLVNWGGFHGPSTVTFAPTTTLLSGASGTGKSTLLDAYIALMMDSNVPFNGASNDATVGRARSADQRSLVSYLRGKTDTSRNTEGDLADQVLRGQNSATWGALAATFVDDNGRRFTVARLYYVPRAATKDSDLTRKLCTVDGTVDLRDVEPFAEGKFDKRAVEGRFPNLKMYKSYDEFSQAFFTRLGIGANGDGGKALRLLARIQAGHQVRTVDDLYKSMVIELPGTYAAADDAVDHFRNLEDAYKAMETERKKAEVLAHIPKLNDDRDKALADAALIDSLGIHQPGDSPLALWKLITEDALLEAAETTNRSRRAEAEKKKLDAEERHTALASRKSAVEAALGENESHALLAKLDEAITRLGFDLSSTRTQRDSFDQLTARLDLAVTSADDFASARSRSQTFINGFDAALTDVKERENALRAAIYEPSKEKSELVGERASLAEREGRMERGLHESRMIISKATGIAPGDLPFVGELIDVLPGQKKWRKAIETTLLGLARVLLIDADDLDRVSRVIDPLTLPRRINYEGVDLTRFSPRDLNPDYVSGKLAYKDSPFTTWVQERVSAENTDALCVDSAHELGGRERRVTVNGQTRKGRSGAHGESNAPYVIGFSKEERLSEINTRIGELDEVLRDIDAQIEALDSEFKEMLANKSAHEHILATQWRDIDSNGIEAEIARLQSERKLILDSDDSLRELQEGLVKLAANVKTAGGEVYTAETALNNTLQELGEIVDRKDRVVGEIQRIERGQVVTLTEEQSTYLDHEFQQVATVGDRKDFAAGTNRLKARLVDNGKRAHSKAEDIRRELEATFQRYLDNDDWGDPNLSAKVENYPSFRRILDTILATGLHERRQEWAKRLTDWSGQDLVPLAGAFSHAIDDIRNRLDPVNAILARLPFGAHQHRLKIDLRELNRDDIAKFKRELKTLSRADTDDFSDEQIQNWFRRLRRFMANIRKDAPGKSNRDYFLDVRKHIEITAVSYDSEGRERSTYAALGGKSGGETQELVAFIVGAALRFQLGDEANERPRFAPVFLDEGFVKADSEFAGRSLAAWKGLGFQLVIGAPYGQFTALEPHAEHVLYMAKSSKGFSSVTALPPADRGAGAWTEASA